MCTVETTLNNLRTQEPRAVIFAPMCFSVLLIVGNFHSEDIGKSFFFQGEISFHNWLLIIILWLLNLTYYSLQTLLCALKIDLFYDIVPCKVFS